ncbi:MAG: hypothetical protein WBM54_06260 [Woeseia sp.]
MPDKKSIRELLEMIFGKGVIVAKLPAVDTSDKIVATFVNDDDQLVALCACDRNFASYSGGALSLIPPDAINEVIDKGEMTEIMSENFHEVMNICSKLLMSDSSAHLRLDKTLSAAESADSISSLAAARASAYSIEIPRYGKGAVHFLVS